MLLSQTDSIKKDKLKKLATYASVSASVFLTLLKLFASLYTGSLAILSSLVDSVSDIFASLITFFAIRISVRPASMQHRYGYGKAEAISSLLQSAFVAGSALFVVYEGVNRMLNPYKITDIGWGLAVICISFFVTLVLVIFQQYVVRKTESLAVSADRLHYLIDLTTNLAIIISLVLVKFFDFEWFDTIAAIFVAGYLLYNAYDIAKKAIDMLMDKELPEEIREMVSEAVKTCDKCHGIHDLRTHDLGGTYMFEFHLEMDGNLSLYEAHDVTENVVEKIRNKFPDAQIIIHQDPYGLEEERLDNKLSK